MSSATNLMNEETLRERRNHDVSAAQIFLWSLKREFWEYRSLYLAPLGAAAVFLFAFLIVAIGGSHVDPTQPKSFHKPYDLAAMLIMGTTFVLSLWYSLDCLHGERRDRSILFWKSLPVSDLTTVLAKASIPVVYMPLISFMITFLVQAIMMIIASGSLMMRGHDTAAVWQQLSFGPMWGGLFTHLMVGHVLWYAPIYAYLMLVSAWAKRAPVLWAVIPPFAIAFGEKVAFGTTRFAQMIGYRFAGGNSGMAMDENMQPMHSGMAQFFAERGLWIGLGFAALFIYTAIQVRRARGPA